MASQGSPPRRRSARLQKSSTPERSTYKKAASSSTRLGSVIERDETPEDDAHTSLNTMLSTPHPASNSYQSARMNELSSLKTPKTLPPMPALSEMHPELIHKSTAKAPDTGSRLGFGDPATATQRDTPSKSKQEEKFPESLKSPAFSFKFSSDHGLDEEAQQIMDEVRDKADEIKEGIRARRLAGELQDNQPGLQTAVGRKIATPKGKARRFSDIHMAEFKKMDSIANHPSTFRAQPGFAQPTVTSLKRKGSRAGLDEPERPRTAGKGLSSSKSTPRLGFEQPPSSTSASDYTSPPKRVRKAENEDVSTARPVSHDLPSIPSRSSNLPRPKSSNNLFSPTKASLARSATSNALLASSAGKSAIPRSASSKSLRALLGNSEGATKFVPASTSKVASLIKRPSMPSMKPLRRVITPNFEDTKLRTELLSSSRNQTEMKRDTVTTPTSKSTKSKLPTFSGLKSILRRTTSRPLSNDPVKLAAGTHVASPSGNPTISDRLNSISTEGAQRAAPRRSTFFQPSPTPKKHVEFTPSVKDRYDLAAASPSPAKGLLPKDVPNTKASASKLYDSSAFILNEETEDENAWESAEEGDSDEENQVSYPTLPVESTSSTIKKATPKSRRETAFIPRFNPDADYPTTTSSSQHEQQRPLSRHDPGFKSIFTTLRKPSSKLSPATLRRIREGGNLPIAKPGATASATSVAAGSGQAIIDAPYPDINTIPHGLPGKKKRRRSSSSVGEVEKEGKKLGFQDMVPKHLEEAEREISDHIGRKRKSFTPMVPGGWGRDFDESPSFLETTNASRQRSEQPQRRDTINRSGAAPVYERAIKRMKMSSEKEKDKDKENVPPMGKGKGKIEVATKVEIPVPKSKNKSKGREQAKENAKARKSNVAGMTPKKGAGAGAGRGEGAGALSVSRLNALARPKERKG
ncbi:MAG: hypothetical protein Q9227_001137 [Pyrenula ochraceoflavens]